MKRIVAFSTVVLAGVLGVAQGTQTDQTTTTQNPQTLPKQRTGRATQTNKKIIGAKSGDKVSLNPQPLPPGPPDPDRKVTAAGDKVSLNPQPLPPGPPDPDRKAKTAGDASKVTSTKKIDKVTLNPQPLPPGPPDPEAKAKASAGEKVSLNPQPLPPRNAATQKKVTTTSKATQKVTTAGEEKAK